MGFLRINSKTAFVPMLVIGAILVFSLLESVPGSFITVVILWTCLFMYTMLAKERQAATACFLIAFFVFLIGRQFCFHFFHAEQVYEYLNSTNQLTYIVLSVSMIGLFVGMVIGKRVRIKMGSAQQKSFLDKKEYGKNYQAACMVIFLISFACALTAVVLQIIFVRQVGYLESYTEDAGGAGIPRLVSAFTRITPLSLGLLLATKPKKRTAILILGMYEFYGVLTLLTGQRYPFVGISMYVLIYFVIRNRLEKGWIKKSQIVVLFVALPFLIILLNAYDTIRLGEKFTVINAGASFEEFLVKQGGSVNVIRRTIYSADEIKDMKYVSFNGIYTVVFENPISRRLLNVKSYYGNSVDRALHSHSLAHRLSYLAYGEEYLRGRGTGTSFVAELLHDFGLIGVFFGSLLYGLILRRIDRISFTNKLRDGIRLAMIYYLLLSPRGEFDSFIAGVFNIYTIVGFLAIIALARVLFVSHENVKDNHLEEGQVE